MIDLSLYSKFERDIQSKNTSIYPLLIIGEFYTNRVNRVHTMPTLAEYLLNPYKLATI